MANKKRRLSNLAKEFDVKISSITEFLKGKGHSIENNPMAKISDNLYSLLKTHYDEEKPSKQSSKLMAMEANLNISSESNKLPELISLSSKNIAKEIGHRYFINFDKDQAILCESNKLSLKDLNIPQMVAKFRKPMSWFIKVTGFRLKEKTLLAEIISYHEGFNKFTTDQIKDQSFLKQIRSVDFSNINVDSLLLSSSGNQPDISTNNLLFETFFIPFDELKFSSGKVNCKKWIWQINESVIITIFNSHVLEEFDSVKNYFQKALGINEIKIELRGEIIGNSSLKNMSASSIEISRINKNLIDIVKIDIVKQVIRSKSVASYPNSFTIEKIFSTATNNEIRSSVFYSDEYQFLNDIIIIKKPKHESHLKYLSLNQLKSQKLNFLIKPFSFIFLLEGENSYYTVWETLDTSEATYIWPIEKNNITLSDNLKKIELIIYSLKDGGKIAYKSTSDHSFKTINHDYSEDNSGFQKWRLSLETILK